MKNRLPQEIPPGARERLVRRLSDVVAQVTECGPLLPGALLCIAIGVGCSSGRSGVTPPLDGAALDSRGAGGVAGGGGGPGTGGAAGATPPVDAAVDAASCASISSDYAMALQTAQECTVGAANQCQLQVRSGFFCNCTTFANSNADVLSAIATRYQEFGCQTVCGGVCVPVHTATCMRDTASSLGGRCQAVALLNLTAMDSAGTYPATIGTEIDITLESPAPGSYSTTMTLSSAAATILEVTIPAGPPTPNGPTRLYRMRATSSGMAHLQIPFEPSGTGASRPPFGVTINVR